jgi:DNA replication initiation complex subunit (GINS family)
MGSEQNNSEVVITYETLFEIFRREKNRGELQKLDDAFLRNVITYLIQKKNIIERQSAQTTLFSEEDRINAEKQAYNIKKIIRDIYERREKKIIDMALNKSRTQSLLVDDSALLKEERVFYNEIVRILDRHRHDILMKLLNAEMPEITIEEAKKESPREISLKFVEDTPEFVGPEMEMLGPFAKDDTATFPAQIASILLSKGCAERIEQK